MRWLFLFLFLPAAAFAGENCSSYNGQCRIACTEHEVSEEGDFLDCRDRELCCVLRADPDTAVIRCCVHSFDPAGFGPGNCSLPVEGHCTKGSSSRAECGRVPACGGG